MPDVSPRTAWLLLAVIVACGAGIRFYRLDHRPLGHVEAYTPGIEFPAGVSAPAPRLTLRDAVRGSFDEVHPPVWYALTWPWTRVAGTSLRAMRTPSAILGTLCILLVFLVGRASHSRAAGLVAAALLAGHGQHYFWSQMSRPSVLGCTISLAATLLLLRTARGDRPRPGSALAFFVLSFLGLGTSYYYWPLFGAQLAWTWGALAARREQLTGLFRWSVLVVVLATPVAGLAVYQSAGRENYLATDTLRVFRELVGMCFPFHHVNDDPHVPFLPPGVLACLPFLFGGLLLAGALARKRSPDEGGRGIGSPPQALNVAASLLAVGALLAAAWALSTVERHADKALPVALIAVIPAIGGAKAVFERRTAFMSLLAVRLLPKDRGLALVTVAALAPPAMLFTLNLFMPFLVPRHMLVFTPYLLVLMAIGLVTLITRLPRLPRVAAAVVATMAVGVVLSASIEYDYHRSASVTDYAGAAHEWLADLRDDDVVFMTRHWVNTPILYYVRHLDREWTWRDWGDALRDRDRARVWLVWYEGVPPCREMTEALASRERTRVIERKNVTIELWEAP